MVDSKNSDSIKEAHKSIMERIESSISRQLRNYSQVAVKSEKIKKLKGICPLTFSGGIKKSAEEGARNSLSISIHKL